jgi:hypothetical protein
VLFGNNIHDAAALGVELVWLRGKSADGDRQRLPIRAAPIEVELEAIEAALSRIRAQIRPPARNG